MEYINADDVIAFCPYLMNKMHRNLIKIRSCAIFSWFKVSSCFKVDKLNSELNKLSTWFKANKLSLNLKKTNFMLFKPRQKRYHFPMQICINDQRIEQVKETVFLGVVLGNRTFLK